MRDIYEMPESCPYLRYVCFGSDHMGPLYCLNKQLVAPGYLVSQPLDDMVPAIGCIT